MYVNTINFFGSNLAFDAESEYRLAALGSQIIEAKRLGTNLSTQVKSSFMSSVLGDAHPSSIGIDQAVLRAADARKGWALVALSFAEAKAWHKSKLRPEYVMGFKAAALDLDLHSKLVAAGLSRDYMRWSFDAIRQTLQTAPDAESGVLSCFDWLSTQAEKIANATSAFGSQMVSLRGEASFDIYKHAFQTLGMGVKKPELYALDEKAFALVADFDIYYEAFEQIAREAHLKSPGTHPDLNYFDLKFRA